MIFKNLKQIKQYYNKETNTYDFTKFYLIAFDFDLKVESNIKAWDIKAWDIEANDIEANNIEAWTIKANDIKSGNITTMDIKANDIKAGDIRANSIKANDISYYAFCVADIYIKCNSIKGRRAYSFHKALDEEVIEE